MRHQGTDLVQHRDARGDPHHDREGRQRHRPRRDQQDQRDRPATARRLDPQPLRPRLALGRTAAKGGVDRQAGIALDHQTTQRRRQRGQRGQDREPDQQRDRRQRGNDDKDRQRPRLHQRKREIFGVLRGAIAGSRVMQIVDALVHERRHEHRHANQQVPPQPEPGQRRMLDMRQFVNEAECAVQGQHRDDAGDGRQPDLRHQDRCRQRAIAQQDRRQQVAPIGPRRWRVKLARQFGGRAQHRLIVGDPVGRRPRRAIGRGRAWIDQERGVHGTVHWRKIMAAAWHLQPGCAAAATSNSDHRHAAGR